MENPVGRRIGLNPVPDVHTCNTSTLVSQLCQPTPDEYNQFNLQNINAPTPPKWKNNENILEDFKKFKRSCKHIFDRPMAHITNGKVKTNMFLIYDSLQWHINTVRPTGEIKAMDGLARQHLKSKSRGGSNTRRPQQSIHPDKPKSECTACGTVHQVGEYPATSSVCFKCNKQGHFSRLCQSTTISTPGSNRNTRGS